jgi:GNAT superfamily N-acetyltransferase
MSSESDTAVLDVPKIVTDSVPSRLDIVPAKWEHAPRIVEILRSSAEWYEKIVEPEDLSEHFVDMEWAKENLERRDFYVGRVGDEIAGTLSLQRVGDDAFYLGYVYLHTDHVGNGYGEDLLDFARDRAKEEGRSQMVLIAHPEAVWAKKAYLRYGFEIIAKDREDVLSWHDGWLKPYYEEGFELYRYEL